MVGGLALAAPHRLYRGPEEALTSSGSWRALCICPCGNPYCWYKLFKVQEASWPWLYYKGLELLFLECFSHIPVTNCHITLQTIFKCLQVVDEFCYASFQQFSFVITRRGFLLAQDKQIQGYIEEVRELDKQVHGTASFTSLNVTQKASVNIQCSRKFLLCIAALDAELADTCAALFYVINHCMASNLDFREYAVRDGGHGYLAMYGCQRSRCPVSEELFKMLVIFLWNPC